MSYSYKMLTTSGLFRSFSLEELEQFMVIGDCFEKHFDPGIDILTPGEPVPFAGVILSGFVDVLHMSVPGGEDIVARYGFGETIAESFHLTQAHNRIACIRSVGDTTVLFMNLLRVMKAGPRYSFYAKFVSNLSQILATTNIRLNTKIELLSHKTLREKLLVYFYQLSDLTGSSTFRLGFTREQLAQYLGSERSSVCRELSKMQDDGLIKIEKKMITLLCL